MLHIFITNKQTLKIHLEYLFAGTGVNGELSPFLWKHNVSHSWTKEKILVSMLADISRVREGDKIAFYLQGNWNQKGKFFGIFEACSRAFFDESNHENFLNNELGREIPYRLLIKPYRVFAKGIEERELLDNLEGKEKPWQLCWSLIYRKLRGNRGCTMLTEYEEKEFIKRLELENNNQYLEGDNFSFDLDKEEIVVTNNKKDYSGRKDSCDIQNRLVYKLYRGNSCESHLQTYVLQNFDSPSLKELLLPEPSRPFWIGNEVSCGTGLQRIDLLIKQENEESIFIKIIELKDEKVDLTAINKQFAWYIKWITQYFVPSYLDSKKKIVIIPCLIARENGVLNLLDCPEIKNLSLEKGISISKPETILFEMKGNLLSFRKTFAN